MPKTKAKPKESPPAPPPSPEERQANREAAARLAVWFLSRRVKHHRRVRLVVLREPLAAGGVCVGSTLEALARLLSPSLWEATRRYARAYGLEPELLAAVVWVESRYCPQAISPAGARGLGQLMPATARGMGVPEHLLHDPQWNLWGSARYLRQQWEAFRNWELALAAYNAGPARVRQYGGLPPLPETRQYVRNVLYVYRFLKQGYNKSR